MKRIPSLDGFRAISIILVLFAHSRFSIGFPVKYTKLVEGGDVGVTVFFVISGFLITYLLLNEKLRHGNISLKNFYLRRAIRILPAVFLYLLFMVIWSKIEPTEINLSDLIPVFTFTENFHGHPWLVLHFWSLSVEEQFYIFWPCILLLFNKHLITILGVLIAYSCLVRVLDYKFPAFNIITLGSFFENSDAIFIGCIAGIFFVKNPDIFKHKIFSSYILQIIALITIIIFVYCHHAGKFGKIALPFGNIIISVSILLIILSYIHPSNNIIFKFLNSKPMVHIGVLSYSIYIWQEFFNVSTFKVWWRTFPYSILVAYLAGLIAYYLWEKQFLKLKRFVND
jgi:peptidoglycan/LPS O-acetylase OafA/YrhL